MTEKTKATSQRIPPENLGAALASYTDDRILSKAWVRGIWRKHGMSEEDIDAAFAEAERLKARLIP